MDSASTHARFLVCFAILAGASPLLLVAVVVIHSYPLPTSESPQAEELGAEYTDVCGGFSGRETEMIRRERRKREARGRNGD